MWALKVSVMDEIGLAVVYKIRSVVDRKGGKSHMWDTALSVMWLWEYLEEKLFGNGIVYHIKSWTDIIRGVGNMETPDDFHISHFNGAERTETQLERRECIKDAAERDTDIEKSWDTFCCCCCCFESKQSKAGISRSAFAVKQSIQVRVAKQPNVKGFI